MGCLNESVAKLTGEPPYDHGSFEILVKKTNWPYALVSINERIFEWLSPAEAKKWPERFVKAIPDGADLSGVFSQWFDWYFAEMIMKDFLLSRKNMACTAAFKMCAEIFAREGRGDLPKAKKIMKRQRWQWMEPIKLLRTIWTAWTSWTAWTAWTSWPAWTAWPSWPSWPRLDRLDRLDLLARLDRLALLARLDRLALLDLLARKDAPIMADKLVDLLEAAPIKS